MDRVWGLAVDNALGVGRLFGSICGLFVSFLLAADWAVGLSDVKRKYPPKKMPTSVLSPIANFVENLSRLELVMTDV